MSDQRIVGAVSQNASQDSCFSVTITITDPKVIESIRSGGTRELSIGYHAVLVPAPWWRRAWAWLKSAFWWAAKATGVLWHVLWCLPGLFICMAFGGAPSDRRDWVGVALLSLPFWAAVVAIQAGWWTP